MRPNPSKNICGAQGRFLVFTIVTVVSVGCFRDPEVSKMTCQNASQCPSGYVCENPGPSSRCCKSADGKNCDSGDASFAGNLDGLAGTDSKAIDSESIGSLDGAKVDSPSVTSTDVNDALLNLADAAADRNGISGDDGVGGETEGSGGFLDAGVADTLGTGGDAPPIGAGGDSGTDGTGGTGGPEAAIPDVSVVQPAALAILPTTFSFSSGVSVGTPASQVFTISNSGGSNTSALTMPTLTGDAAFSIAAQNCNGAVLTPAGSAGASCTVTVQFSPSSYGAMQTTLRASATVGGLASATISGTGVQTFSLTVTNNGGGTITSSPAGDIVCGTTCIKTYSVSTTAPSVTLTATPGTSLTFGAWSGGACSGSGTCVLTMSANRAVTATFNGTLQVTISDIGGATGSVASVTPSGFSCASGSCSNSYAYNTPVSLSATPGANAVFNGWSGACTNSSGNCLVTLSQAQNVTAQFGPDCKASSTSAVHYVDHANGTDDANHGGASGGCAYKTLSYALSQATGSVSLVAGDTFPGGVAGETLPYSLLGTQGILCNGAKLTWSSSASYNGIVSIAGTLNKVDSCVIDGASLGGDCFVVLTSGSSTGHVVSANTIKNCANGAVDVHIGVTNLNFTGNTFVNNFDGITFDGNNGSSLTNNSMVDNNIDIYCADAGPSVTGSGNVRGTGSVNCSTCSNCSSF